MKSRKRRRSRRYPLDGELGRNRGQRGCRDAGGKRDDTKAARVKTYKGTSAPRDSNKGGIERSDSSTSVVTGRRNPRIVGGR